VKQEVFVIGRELRALVPYSLAFAGIDYSVTLVQADDVVARAAALAAEHEAWYLLLLDNDDDAAGLQWLAKLPALASMAVDEIEDPVVAVAHLIALAHWDAAAPSTAGVRETEEQYG
jgi:hypothetical protein